MICESARHRPPPVLRPLVAWYSGYRQEGWPVPPGSFGCYVVTDDPDGLFARACAAGAEILAGLHETDYGSRDFAVRDPEGNRWSFGTYRGEPRKGTAG